MIDQHIRATASPPGPRAPSMRGDSKSCTVWLIRPLTWLIALMLLFSADLAAQVTLKLKDADIRALIETVSAATGKNFVIDPRVKGKVTVISSKPMDKDELFDVFLSILQVHDFAAVQVGDLIKIVPETNAKQSPVPTLAEPSAGPKDELVSRVLQIENVPAAQLVPILRPLVPQQGHLAAYTPSNVLVITDRSANIDRLVGIIRRIDQSTGAEIDLMPLKHANADEVLRIVQSLKQKGGGNRGQAGAAAPEGIDEVLLAADQRTNSILISGERAARLQMRALIAHLDTPVEATGKTQVVYLRFADATALVPILKGVQSTQEGGSTGQQQRSSSQKVDIQADEATNSLIITASPETQRELRSVIERLDIRRAQVLVESIIAEVSVDKSRELGVELAVDGTPQSNGPVGTSLFGSANGIASLATNPAGIIGQGLTLAVGDYNRKGVDWALLLKALYSDASNNVISTPSITTLDNEEAEIVVGQEVPFVTGSFSSTGSGGGATPTNPFQTIQRENVGLTLKVKPQINEGDIIKMEIEQELSAVSSSSVLAADLITTQRSIKTIVLVEDGEMLVLGGLIDDNVRDQVGRVPGLASLPLLGNLFKSRSSTRTKQNLMVFMRPTVIRDRTTSARLTAANYSYIRDRQLNSRLNSGGLFGDEEPAVLPNYFGLTVNPPRIDFDPPSAPAATEARTEAAQEAEE